MISIYETLTMLCSFLFYYFLLFVWLPSLVIRFNTENCGLLDKLYISLTHSTLFFIVAIHLLVAVRLLETITLLALVLAAFVLLSRYYTRNESVSISIKVMTALFDLTEDREQWKIELRRLMHHIRDRIQGQIKSAKVAAIRHPFLIIAYLLVFGAAMVDRFRYSFTHLSFASSDSYVHLGWSKFLSNMTIYSDGVYPYGFEAIIATLYKLFQLDMYVIVRFMGALTAFLMVLSLVFALRKMVGKDYITILLAAFLLFYSTAVMIHNEVILWRQLSALSMEFAAIFLLPGITFLYLFFRTGRRLYLVLSAECYAITVFTHPFVAVTLTLSYIAVGIANFGKLWIDRTMLRIIVYMAAAGVIGIIPPVVGLLSGKSFHGSSINYFRGELASNEKVYVLDTIIAYSREQPLVIVMCILVALYSIVHMFNRRKNMLETDSNQTPVLFGGIIVVFMSIMYLSPRLGLPAVVAVDRQPVFLSMTNALLLGLLIGVMVKGIAQSKIGKKLQAAGCAIIILVVLVIPGQKMNFPPGDQHQYDEAIRGYLDIKANYPLKNWDIISPVDELGIIVGYGFHTELWEFVRNLEDKDKRTIEFKTPYVFLFVEKVPMDIMGDDFRPITPEDASKPFPVTTSGQLTEFYYGSNVENRRILEAKAYYWAEDYMKNHTDMKVFMDTPRYKIYEIYQGKDEVILTKRQVNAD